MSASMTYDEMVHAAVALGIPRAVAERSAADEILRRSTNGVIAARLATISALQRGEIPHTIEAQNGAQRPDRTVSAHVGANRFSICPSFVRRRHDELTATFETPPRTKKNHTRWFGVQSHAYVRYRDAIVAAVTEVKSELALPLPDQAYNLEAVFYVDGAGKNADLFGLLQAIADALENAGVISNDWYFRTTNGSRVIEDDDVPRVVVTITPIEA